LSYPVLDVHGIRSVTVSAGKKTFQYKKWQGRGLCRGALPRPACGKTTKLQCREQSAAPGRQLDLQSRLWLHQVSVPACAARLQALRSTIITSHGQERRQGSSGQDRGKEDERISHQVQLMPPLGLRSAHSYAPADMAELAKLRNNARFCKMATKSKETAAMTLSARPLCPTATR